MFFKFKKDSSFKPEYIKVEEFPTAGLGRQLTSDVKNIIVPFEPEKMVREIFIVQASSSRNSSIDKTFLYLPTKNTIWVSCEGETDYESSLLGKVEYTPWKGFPGYFFPYRNQSDYWEPLVAIRFANAAGRKRFRYIGEIPEKQFSNLSVGTFININCKIVAKNFSETIKFGLVIFKSS